jgi:hypothetical protein
LKKIIKEILVRPKTGESALISFTPKFTPISSQKFADLGEIRPNWLNFARNFLGRNFLGRNLTARIRPFRTSFAQKNYCVDVTGCSRKPSTPQYPERIHELLYRFYAIQERIACYIEIKNTSKLIKASHRCIDRFINPVIRSVKFDEREFPTPGLI